MMVMEGNDYHYELKLTGSAVPRFILGHVDVNVNLINFNLVLSYSFIIILFGPKLRQRQLGHLSFLITNKRN